MVVAYRGNAERAFALFRRMIADGKRSTVSDQSGDTVAQRKEFPMLRLALWGWILGGNAAALFILSNIGGSTSAMSSRTTTSRPIDPNTY